MQWMFVCSACQSEMANTIARVLTSLLSADEERTVQEQQQQHVRLAYGDYCTAYTWVCLRQAQCTLTISCLSSYRMANDKWLLPSVLWRCWLGDRKGIRPVKNLSGGVAGVVICLEWDADLHMAQLMPLPLTVSRFSKIQIGFYWYQLTQVVPEKGR